MLRVPCTHKDNISARGAQHHVSLDAVVRVLAAIVATITVEPATDVNAFECDDEFTKASSFDRAVQDTTLHGLCASFFMSQYFSAMTDDYRIASVSEVELGLAFHEAKSELESCTHAALVATFQCVLAFTKNFRRSACTRQASHAC